MFLTMKTDYFIIVSTICQSFERTRFDDCTPPQLLGKTLTLLFTLDACPPYFPLSCVVSAQLISLQFLEPSTESSSPKFTELPLLLLFDTCTTVEIE